MSKKPPTDEQTTAPSIEETIDAKSTAFLGEFDAFMQDYARGIKTNWHGLTPTDRIGHAQLLRRMAGTGLRKPTPAASMDDLPRQALGLRP